ncbi:MAG: type 1 glutamine amidotransferase [Janthinobacterium lividum]
MRWHCLYHRPEQGPGYAADWLAAHGHPLTYTRLFEPEPVFPALGEFDGLLVLGGEMSVYDEDYLPWLREEKAFLQQTLRAGKLTLAIGLGAQLLAQALGGEVHPNPEPEFGFWTVRFAAKALAHPLLRSWPDKAAVLHWHFDTFTVPPGALRVGMSAGCAVQGFVWGDGVIGLQFHPEMSEELVEQLLAAEDHDLIEEEEFVQTADQMRTKLKSVWKGRKLLETLLTNMVALHEHELNYGVS